MNIEIGEPLTESWLIEEEVAFVDNVASSLGCRKAFTPALSQLTFNGNLVLEEIMDIANEY